MSENEIDFEQLAAELSADPAIREALSDHEAACESEDEDTCIVCQTNRALSSLTFVLHALDHHADENIDEMTIAESIVDDLPSALQLISVCQNSIKLLSEIANAATFIIAHNELEIEDDEDEDD